jgi:hypothetical protein
MDVLLDFLNGPEKILKRHRHILKPVIPDEFKILHRRDPVMADKDFGGNQIRIKYNENKSKLLLRALYFLQLIFALYELTGLLQVKSTDGMAPLERSQW